MAKESTPQKNSVALIAGPTASGKSAHALELVAKLKKAGREAVIVNADSMQVYADIPIVSAAPSEEERAQCEHRLYGEWDGADPCSAPDWAARAREEIASIHTDGGVPILVGGTGMYLKVLIEGIAPIPEIDPEVREVVRSMATDTAYAALQIEDPLRAAELEPGDSQRIARALGKLVVRAGKPVKGGTEIAFPLTRQDLSELAGTTMHSVSRCLSAWERDGIVLSKRRKVIVLHPHRLQKIAA